jgi:hypothetical protein
MEEKSLQFTGNGGIGRSISGWANAQGGENRAAGWNMDRVITDGYERVVWVYKARATSRVCRSASAGTSTATSGKSSRTTPSTG